LLSGHRLINPDDIALARLGSMGIANFADASTDVLGEVFLWAAQEAEKQLRGCVEACIPVCIETVLSTTKYMSIVTSVVARGGFVGLIYVTLASPELAVERVALRVRNGGHEVPQNKVKARWQRSLEQLPAFASRVSAFWIYDNTDSSRVGSIKLLAYGFDGELAYAGRCECDAVEAAISSIPGWEVLRTEEG
jgi:predicted ABC-type ATPase